LVGKLLDLTGAVSTESPHPGATKAPQQAIARARHDLLRVRRSERLLLRSPSRAHHSAAPEAIRELHALSLKLVMLTGDNLRTAAAVAKILGLDAVEAEIEPTGKVSRVKKLRAEGKHVRDGRRRHQ
jgi:P-type E1-E2 ATPase